MRKIMICICFIFLSGCQLNNIKENHQVNSYNINGLESIILPENQTLATYSIKTVDKEKMIEATKVWLGTEEIAEENEYSNSKEYVFKKNHMSITIAETLDPTNFVLILTTSQGDIKDSLFSYLKQIQEENFMNQDNTIISTFDSPIQPNINEVEIFLNDFMTSYSLDEFKYNVYIRSISNDNIAKMQEIISEYFEDDEYSSELTSNNIDEFYSITIEPCINNIPIIDDTVHFGSIDQLNVTSGPMFDFIIDKQGIVYAYIVQLRLPGEELESYKVSKAMIQDAIEKVFDDLILQDEIEIQAVKFVYAPIPQNHNQERNTDFIYTPLIQVNYRYEDFDHRLFIDPKTGLEVR